MPLETSQRYGMNNIDNSEPLEESNIKRNLIKKFNDLFIKFKEWIND